MYILDSIFQLLCPLVVGYQIVVEWVDISFDAFQCQVNSPLECTRFTYNLSRVEAGYYNTCIQASTIVLIGNPGAKIPVSFQ